MYFSKTPFAKLGHLNPKLACQYPPTAGVKLQFREQQTTATHPLPGATHNCGRAASLCPWQPDTPAWFVREHMRPSACIVKSTLSESIPRLSLSVDYPWLYIITLQCNTCYVTSTPLSIVWTAVLHCRYID